MPFVRTLAVCCLLFGCATLLADRVELVAGDGTEATGVAATKAKLAEPFAVDFDRDGNLYIAEMTSGERVVRVDPKGTLTTFAGTGKKGKGGDGGDPLKAEFNGIHHLAITPSGDVYLADTFNNTVRKFDAKTKLVTRFAGTGEKGFGGDGGPADKAKFSGTFCLAFDPNFEKLYVADLGNRRVRMIDMKTNTISTVAGTGKSGVPEDGSEASQSPLVDPRAVAVDASNNLYVLERGGHALRVIDAGGKIRTVVGTGKAGLSGDGGDALKATLNGPKHLCIDSDQGVLIADAENNVVRKYLPKEGKIVRIAGTGKKGATFDADPLKLELHRPHGVFVHPSGDLYITDSYNDRILRVVRSK
jgi:sugar lactone lactonase YvrE